MPSTTYVARRPGPFSALVQSAEIGGLRLEPLAPVRVLDRYYDTEAGELLRRGLALRVREQGGEVTLSLRGLEGEPALPPETRIDAIAAGDGPLVLPRGPLGDAVREIVGPEHVRPLLALRQYRTPRVAHRDEAAAGVVSFDVVVYEVPGSRVVSNEVEVDAAGGGEALRALDPVFVERGLERAERSKLERGLLRLVRPLAEPALVLPDEREALEAAAASDDPDLRRRAEVVLLDARGFRPDTIAAQTGLSMARVRHWRQRFRDVRLGVLDPEPAAAPRRAPRWPTAPLPADPPMGPPPAAEPPAPPPAPEAPPPPAAEGDGLGGLPEDPTHAADMAELLELFSPPPTDTPFFEVDDDPDELPLESDRVESDRVEAPADGLEAPRPDLEAPGLDGGAPARDGAVDDEGLDALVPPPALPPAARRDPYPIVLGPIALPPDREEESEPDADPFGEVDLGALRRARDAGRRRAPERKPQHHEPVGQVGLEAADATDVGPGLEAPPAPALDRPALTGDTPLVRGAEATLGYHLALFDARAERFLASRVPSDARRLLVAAHGLRLAVETFEAALPAEAGRRLVSALRPLVQDLDTALDRARAAVAAGGRRDLVRETTEAVGAAAARLEAGAAAWGARARRLARRLADQSADGALRSDDAPLADDYVGPVGDAPTATRLRHVLGSAVWARFEAVRAFEDDLEAPTPRLAQHLAVALSGLRFVVGLAEGAVEGPVRDVAEALEAAEREVVEARERAVRGRDLEALSALVGVWSEVTGRPFKKRLAAIVATV